MINFTFTQTKEELIDFLSLKSKVTKIMPLTYFLCVGVLAINVYLAFSTKQFATLIATIIMVAIFLPLLYFSTKVLPKKKIDKSAKNDKNFFCKYRVSIGSDFVEFKAEEPVSLCVCHSVYPYSIINAIFETEKSYNILVPGADALIIPKKALTPELVSQISEIFSSHSIYSYIK